MLPGEYNGSIYDGVDKLIARMERESIDCPTEKFVVVGYSQGALAAHLALGSSHVPTRNCWSESRAWLLLPIPVGSSIRPRIGGEARPTNLHARSICTHRALSSP
ncbi:cutinase family protein [Cellulomonas sp.]|uniref:cutinase family protein n=1 Tax=Cellulomonas sp. TaxID=40001 RepID=UPI003390491A